jgi:hypothetical protein
LLTCRLAIARQRRQRPGVSHLTERKRAKEVQIVLGFLRFVQTAFGNRDPLAGVANKSLASQQVV